ncbi:MAG TPA: YebC/PmpR family DNA-binding transcriptional regulator [Anaerolineae bacterium]|nr:YebC/PmpR family DNA-binding transcriptional regulator [Anaerolineae bacterium]
MSGHSKWSTIKRKKAAADAKRGKLFTKLAREIAVAAREGGPELETNFKLRLVVEKAKAANMPKDNIERAIRRGAGLEKGEALEEITYEGYGPHGVALLVHVLTDNRNRAVSAVRRTFTRYGGSLGETGCVAWLFESKGYLTVEPNDHDPEQLFEVAVEAGAEDVVISDDLVEIYTDVGNFSQVRDALRTEGIPLESAQLSMIPKSLVSLGEKETMQVMHLIDALEGLDDVQEVYSNLEIPDEIMLKYEHEMA